MSETLRTRGSARALVVEQIQRAATQADSAATDIRRLDILDSGGGTGTDAVPLAALGHRVTVVDPSPDALAALVRRAADAGVTDLVRPLQGDACALLDVVPAASFDAVLCHGVLEVVDDPVVALTACNAVLRPHGFLSVLCANRNAAVLARVVAGQIPEARHLLAAPADRTDTPPPRRYTVDRLVTVLAAAGFAVRSIHGVRTFTDLVPEAVVDGDPAAFAALAELESLASVLPDFQAIAAQVHVIADREQPTASRGFPSTRG